MTASIQADGPRLTSPTTSSQRWLDATFLHWRVEPLEVARLLPPGLTPDTYDGSAWVGLIPFRMADFSAFGTPKWASFPETNVRTYTVDKAGRRGVWFFSLDTTSRALTSFARTTLGVPYRLADMSIELLTGAQPTASPASPAPAALPVAVTYECRRRRAPQPRSKVAVRVGERLATPSDLQLFLTARFGAHVRHLGITGWMPNTHAAWPLQEAELIECADELVATAGFKVTDRPPDSVLYSPGVATRFGWPTLA